MGEDELTMPQIKGRKIELSEGRHVFLGQCSDWPGFWFVEFRNLEGILTRLKMSEEALQALSDLKMGRQSREAVEVSYDWLVPAPVWTVVSTSEA